MPVTDVNSLFSRAEQAFVAGQLEAARTDLLQIVQLVADHPAVLHLLALVEKKRGALDASRAAFMRALNVSPGDPQINNNYANLLDALGEPESALRHFELALRAAPGFADARFNRALLLQRLGRLDEALDELDQLAQGSAASAKIQSARGAVLRELGRLGAAAEAYDAALRVEPGRATALHGRARVALERGEADAPARFEQVAKLIPHDAHAALGAAESWVAVDSQRALRELEAVASRFPEWPEPQSALARLKWEGGDSRGFAAGLESAVAAQPGNAPMWRALVEAYSGVDRFDDAADTATRALAAVGDEEFRLLEAVNASEAGDIARADALFSQLVDKPGTNIAQASQCLKKGDVHHAEKLLNAAREDWPEDIAAWAWTGLVWRLLDDPRADWLYQTDRLVRVQSIGAAADQLEAIAEHVAGLHELWNFPIGQSLRGGSQTRGRLFDQAQEPIRTLQKLLKTEVDAYWDALPDEDPAHPLLRHGARSPRFAGSWSVRLTGAGFHVPHFHPRGALSSAYYLRLPPQGRPGEGWLELGSLPPRLRLSLPPLMRIEPKPGVLALFPSYMFHGTVPFTKGERLTVAFDVVA